MNKLITDFSKYTLIGIIISIMNILFTWLLIDIIGLDTIIATTSVLMVLHILKFYSYRMSNLFDRQIMGQTQFTIYTTIVIFSSILHVLLVWFFIDIIHIPTFISVTTVVIGLFLMRFVLFKASHLIEEDGK